MFIQLLQRLLKRRRFIRTVAAVLVLAIGIKFLRLDVLCCELVHLVRKFSVDERLDVVFMLLP